MRFLRGYWVILWTSALLLLNISLLASGVDKASQTAEIFLVACLLVSVVALELVNLDGKRKGGKERQLALSVNELQDCLDEAGVAASSEQLWEFLSILRARQEEQ